MTDMKNAAAYKENTMVSSAKGIGILLVLVGHFGFIPEFKRIIYLFHMPLFFFLSGYLFKDRGAKEFLRYVFRKIKSLYFPFIACNLFAMFFHNLFCRIGIYNADDLFLNVAEVLKHIVRILLCIEMEDIVAPMWFLPVLMAVSIVYFVLRAIVKNEEINTGITVLIFLMAYMLMSINRNSGIWRAVILVGTGLWMFHIGHLYRHYENKMREKLHQFPVILGCIAIEILLSLITNINMIRMQFSNPIFFSLGAVLGINTILWMAEIVQPDWLCYIGRNSLTVLEWHYWGAVMVTILQTVIYKNTANGIIVYQGTKTIWFVTYMAFGIGLPLLILGGKEILKNNHSGEL